MTDHKTESEPRKEDEELTLEKEKIRDLDVPEEESDKVKGGRGNPTLLTCSPC
jgi:hypothetical protein